MRITRGDIAAIALLLLVLVSCGATPIKVESTPTPVGYVQPTASAEDRLSLTTHMIHKSNVDCIVVMRYNAQMAISCNWKVEK